MPARERERARSGSASGIEDERFGRKPIGEAGACATPCFARRTTVRVAKLAQHDLAQARVRRGLRTADLG